ncbi:unnamed protein product, partial [Hapterophycus canaliculatus]
MDDCIGDAVEERISSMGNGDIILLENVRFHAGEESNDEEFSKQLAALCDYYVNDAFGTAHRAHASTEGITNFVERKVSACAPVKAEFKRCHLGCRDTSPPVLPV